MKTWFTVKVRYIKTLEDGSAKEITEDYLFEALNYTDAETQAHKMFPEILKGSFTVIEIIKTPLVDVFEYEDENDVWWKVKTSYDTMDGDKVKTVKSDVLIQAEVAKQAVERTLEQHKEFTVDVSVVGINKTKIIEYLKNTA
jgi:hypothetical protein